MLRHPCTRRDENRRRCRLGSWLDRRHWPTVAGAARSMFPSPRGDGHPVVSPARAHEDSTANRFVANPRDACLDFGAKTHHRRKFVEGWPAPPQSRPAGTEGDVAPHVDRHVCLDFLTGTAGPSIRSPRFVSAWSASRSCTTSTRRMRKAG